MHTGPLTETIQGHVGIPETLVGQICSSLHSLHYSPFRLEMTCVIGHEYQCHACQAASIQLHLMHVTSLAVKRLQWAAGGGGEGRWCTGWILAEALTRWLSHLRLKCVCHSDWRNSNLRLSMPFWHLCSEVFLSPAGEILIHLTSCTNTIKPTILDRMLKSFWAVENKSSNLQ